MLETQRKLAEIVEMIHTAQVLNSNVVVKKKPRKDNKNIVIILIILVSKTIFRNDIKMPILVLQSIHQSVVNLPVNIAEEEVSLYK